MSAACALSVSQKSTYLPSNSAKTLFGAPHLDALAVLGIDMQAASFFWMMAAILNWARLFVKIFTFRIFLWKLKLGDFSRLTKMPSQKGVKEGWRVFAVLPLYSGLTKPVQHYLAISSKRTMSMLKHRANRFRNNYVTPLQPVAFVAFILIFARNTYTWTKSIRIAAALERRMEWRNTKPSAGAGTLWRRTWCRQIAAFYGGRVSGSQYLRQRAQAAESCGLCVRLPSGAPALSDSGTAVIYRRQAWDYGGSKQGTRLMEDQFRWEKYRYRFAPRAETESASGHRLTVFHVLPNARRCFFRYSQAYIVMRTTSGRWQFKRNHNLRLQTGEVPQSEQLIEFDKAFGRMAGGSLTPALRCGHFRRAVSLFAISRMKTKSLRVSVRLRASGSSVLRSDVIAKQLTIFDVFPRNGCRNDRPIAYRFPAEQPLC